MTIKGYNKISELRHATQVKLAMRLKKIIIDTFHNHVVATLGFGSFWQDFKNLKPYSDIDFFILLKKQPELKKIKQIRNEITKEVKKLKLCYLPRPHIFVGELSDVANGAENIVRCLTIHYTNIEPPLVIIGQQNFQLLKLIKKSNIVSSLKHALFSIIRHLNYKILNNEDEVFDPTFWRRQQKFLQRIILATFLAQEFFPDIPKILPQQEFDKFLIKDLNNKEITKTLGLLWTAFSKYEQT